MNRFLGLSLLGCLVACADAQDHPHAGDVVLTDGQAYEKNVEVKLAREYWIIIRSEDGTRAMVPRPDGNEQIVAECTSRGPLEPLFRGAALCAPADQRTMARVNAMTADEAIRTSTFLHERLRFVAKAEGGVTPFVWPSDVRDVCARFPAERGGVLRSICDEEARAEESGMRTASFRQYAPDESRAIADRVNELYGIR
jgi:hypothetical protein